MSASAATSPNARLAPSKKAVISVVVAVLAAVAGALYIAMPKRSVSTDNAYLQADSSVVAPRVRGLVAEVLVKHNAHVQRGQPLLRIDSEEFDARVASAAADLQESQASLQAAQAALHSLDAEERLAGSNLRAAQVSIRSADAQSELAESDRKRYDDLGRTGLVARQDVERFRTAAITSSTEAQRSRAALQVSRDQAQVTHSRRQTLLANLAQAEALVARSQAALNLARQDQRNTVVRAPMDGIVGDRQVERGDYVQPGTRTMTVVPLGSLYVVANFKETQTTRMVQGQRAEIEVDALPGVTLHGKVDSFAPGSGSQFSLLPFEPGTGNFTKIVQRVPVRVRIDQNQGVLRQLRPGLSATVKVNLKN